MSLSDEGTVEQIILLARLALERGEEDGAVAEVEAGAAQYRDARLWQWTGLLRRALEETGGAIAAFGEASRLAPDDAGIAHGLARVLFEGGCDARAAYARARALAPADGDVLVGETAARMAQGDGNRAAAELGDLVSQNPLWVQGHFQLAQLVALLGYPALATRSLDEALARNPGDVGLWRALIDLAVRREAFEELQEVAARAGHAGLPPEEVRLASAIAATELGAIAQADSLFGALPADVAPIWRIRHLLRSGRAIEALPLIDREVASERGAAAWPYALAAWRLVGDARAIWLAGNDGFVRVVDLADRLPDLDGLAEVLRHIHRTGGQFLDQSVRGGSQTDGPLFSRIEPAIRAVRAAIVDAVGEYRAALPAPDPRHPLLGPARNRPVRFAGSWSIRLGGGGHHANHVHPQGWVSSALYISLPAAGEGEAGWLTLGEPQAELELGLSPTHRIEPRPGRLVLFPAWMWHGTIPFETGERLTIAFDVARPR